MTQGSVGLGIRNNQIVSLLTEIRDLIAKTFTDHVGNVVSHHDKFKYISESLLDPPLHPRKTKKRKRK